VIDKSAPVLAPGGKVIPGGKLVNSPRYPLVTHAVGPSPLDLLVERPDPTTQLLKTRVDYLLLGGLVKPTAREGYQRREASRVEVSDREPFGAKRVSARNGGH